MCGRYGGTSAHGEASVVVKWCNLSTKRSVRGGFSLRKLQDHRLGSGGRRMEHDDEERGC